MSYCLAHMFVAQNCWKIGLHNENFRHHCLVWLFIWTDILRTFLRDQPPVVSRLHEAWLSLHANLEIFYLIWEVQEQDWSFGKVVPTLCTKMLAGFVELAQTNECQTSCCCYMPHLRCPLSPSQRVPSTCANKIWLVWLGGGYSWKSKYTFP